MRKKSLYEHTLVNGIPLHDAHKMYILHFIQYNKQIRFEKLIKTENTKLEYSDFKHAPLEKIP